MKELWGRFLPFISGAVGIFTIFILAVISLVVFAPRESGRRINSMDCWLLEDGFVAQEGWKIAHLADRGVRDVELSLKPDTVICYPVDKDGLPSKHGYKMRFWYRREK